ncbi:pyroglutamyl-peptidase I [Anaerococcus sp. Marseille-P3625]|uniref:pyroglutamyl-peptidase I n=1 Tax=Anaerococcus sp. Marseille-P3625 TaxID=1977277 RepID=UPI000C06CFC1|nr:pyroglutamyl-peptidase I [Anaerococcus sp. Marseille-P3625]
MKILLTAFDPFANEKINPTLEVLKKLEDNILNAQIIKLKLPTIFDKSSQILEEKIKEIKPDFILSLGQAGGRSKITVERVAINVDDASIKDNAGEKPIDQKIRIDGKNAYFSTLPIKAIVEEIKKAAIPAEISNSAGTFVCNHIMYEGLYFAEKYGNIKAGFIHIPFLPEQVIDKDMPSMNISDIKKSLEIAIATIIKYSNKDDLKISGGSTH